MGDGVAHLHLSARLDAADDVAHVARTQFLAGNHVHLQDAHLVGIIFLARVEKLHLVARVDDAVDNFKIGDNATERVENRVEDETLKGSILVAHRTGNALNNSVEDIQHALARLGATTDDFLTLAAKQVDNLILHRIGIGAGHVALVDDGDDFQVVFDGHVEVTDGLGLYALTGVHYQHSTFAGCDAAGNLVGEVHMSRCVNQIKDKRLSPMFILHLDGVALDSNAALALQFHVIKHLPFGNLDGVGVLQHTVGKG